MPCSHDLITTFISICLVHGPVIANVCYKIIWYIHRYPKEYLHNPVGSHIIPLHRLKAGVLSCYLVTLVINIQKMGSAMIMIVQKKQDMK